MTKNDFQFKGIKTVKHAQTLRKFLEGFTKTVNSGHSGDGGEKSLFFSHLIVLYYLNFLPHTL